MDIMVRVGKSGSPGIIKAFEPDSAGIMYPHCRSAEEAQAPGFARFERYRENLLRDEGLSSRLGCILAPVGTRVGHDGEHLNWHAGHGYARDNRI